MAAGADVDQKDHQNFTPLAHAALLPEPSRVPEKRQIMQVLIANRANVSDLTFYKFTHHTFWSNSVLYLLWYLDLLMLVDVVGTRIFLRSSCLHWSATVTGILTSVLRSTLRAECATTKLYRYLIIPLFSTFTSHRHAFL